MKENTADALENFCDRVTELLIKVDSGEKLSEIDKELLLKENCSVRHTLREESFN